MVQVEQKSHDFQVRKITNNIFEEYKSGE